MADKDRHRQNEGDARCPAAGDARTLQSRSGKPLRDGNEGTADAQRGGSAYHHVRPPTSAMRGSSTNSRANRASRARALSWWPRSCSTNGQPADWILPSLPESGPKSSMSSLPRRKARANCSLLTANSGVLRPPCSRASVPASPTPPRRRRRRPASTHFS